MKKMLILLAALCLLLVPTLSIAEGHALGEWFAADEAGNVLGAYLAGAYNTPEISGGPLIVFFRILRSPGSTETDYICQMLRQEGDQFVLFLNEESRALLFETAFLDPEGNQHVVTGTVAPGTSEIILGDPDEASLLTPALALDGTVKFSLTRVDDPRFHFAFAIPDTTVCRFPE